MPVEMTLPLSPMNDRRLMIDALFVPLHRASSTAKCR
jgi:hypothetical protein